MLYRNLFLIPFLLLFGSVASFASADTTYYDEKWEVLPSKVGADYYRVGKKMSDGLYRVDDYYINGIKQMSGSYKYKDSIREGQYIYYTEYGTKSSEGLFKNDKREGEWKNYRKDGNEVLWYTEYYVDDKMNGSFKSYYKSGKLKREETYKDGERVTGKRFSENGKEMVFTPFFSMPKPSVDIAGYLSKNITYPSECRKKNIEGRVVLKFSVSKEGIINNVSVFKSVHPQIDKEAIRVIVAMPDWIPAMRDDEPIDFYYNQPIRFKLN